MIGEYVTLRFGGQLFGIDATTVQDVFHPRGLTRVPLAAPEIAGVLNWRGRIVTAVCARRRLRLPPAESGREPMAVGLEVDGDCYGLIVDSVEDLMSVDTDQFHAPPGGLPPRWADVIVGVCRLEDELLLILDARRMVDLPAMAQA